MVPTLLDLCARSLHPVVSQVDTAIADCKAQTCALDKRKDELLVELATVSESLEDVHRCRVQLEAMLEPIVEGIMEMRPQAAAEAMLDRLRAPVASACSPCDDAQGVSPHRGGDGSGLKRGGAKAESDREQQRRKKEERLAAGSAKAESGREQQRRKKEERLAAVLPADEVERDALLRRQVVVRGLPAGAADDASLSGLLDKALCSLPAFDATAGRPCVNVQLYSGGTYGFVTMRDESLAATAVLLPPFAVSGSTLTIARVRGFETSSAHLALPVPANLDLRHLALSTPPGAPPPSVSLETKLYWSLRRHETHPKPAEKEVREAFAFFKKSEKILGRKRLVVDVCGSHGLIAALFVAYGKAHTATVLDIVQPASFHQIRQAWAPWLETKPAEAPSVEGAHTGAGYRVQGAEAEDGAQTDDGAAAGSHIGAAAAGSHNVGAAGTHGSEDAAEHNNVEIAPGNCERLQFVVADFKVALPELLSRYAPSEVAVVACHACTHLSDAIVSTCIAAGVDFAVMPCCQRDLLTQGQMGLVAKSLRIKESEAIDIARMGGILARGYDCRWRTIDAAITPQNRLLIGMAHTKPSVARQRQLVEASTANKMSLIYERVHRCGLETSEEARRSKGATGAAVGA